MQFETGDPKFQIAISGLSGNATVKNLVKKMWVLHTQLCAYKELTISSWSSTTETECQLVENEATEAKAPP